MFATMVLAVHAPQSQAGGANNGVEYKLKHAHPNTRFVGFTPLNSSPCDLEQIDDHTVRVMNVRGSGHVWHRVCIRWEPGTSVAHSLCALGETSSGWVVPAPRREYGNWCSVNFRAQHGECGELGAPPPERLTGQLEWVEKCTG
jgi:hypothetical protein